MEPFVLPADTHVGQVHLRVRNLERALDFYAAALGFREAGREGPAVFLSASGGAPYHIVLTGQADATPRPPRAPGLFHMAIRFPDRRALAREVRHLAENRRPIGGAADHLVSEAVYLADPEGNGIELYVDRPRASWPHEDGSIVMATEPLDFEDLLAQVADDRAPWEGIDPRTDIGHVHLQVSDLARAEAFYHGLLGLDVTQRSYPGALFFSAGGYHHHVGANTWNSRGSAPAPAGATGLISWSLVLPGGAAWEQLLARLRSAGASPDLLGYPAGEPMAGVLVRDADGLGVEIQTRRDQVDAALLADLARAQPT